MKRCERCLAPRAARRVTYQTLLPGYGKIITIDGWRCRVCG